MDAQQVILFEKNGEISEKARNLLVSNNIIPLEADDHQVEYFFKICQQNGLNPFLKEAHLVPYNTKKGNGWQTSFAVIIGKDAFLKKANETGLFAGMDAPKFDVDNKGNHKTLAQFKRGEYPNTCEVTVYKIVAGQRVPFTVPVKFSEFAKTRKTQDGKIVLSQKWATMPFHMIAKVATVHSLKAAFTGQMPQGVHIEEELPAIENSTPAAVEVEIGEQVLSANELLKIAKDAEKKVKAAKTKEQLIDIFNSLPNQLKEDEDVIALFKTQRSKIEKTDAKVRTN